MSFSNDFSDDFEHAPTSNYLVLGPDGVKTGDVMYVHIVPSMETIGQSMALTVPTQSKEILTTQIHKIFEDCNAILRALEALS